VEDLCSKIKGVENSCQEIKAIKVEVSYQVLETVAAKDSVGVKGGNVEMVAEIEVEMIEETMDLEAIYKIPVILIKTHFIKIKEAVGLCNRIIRGVADFKTTTKGVVVFKIKISKIMAAQGLCLEAVDFKTTTTVVEVNVGVGVADYKLRIIKEVVTIFNNVEEMSSNKINHVVDSNNKIRDFSKIKASSLKALLKAKAKSPNNKFFKEVGLCSKIAKIHKMDSKILNHKISNLLVKAFNKIIEAVDMTEVEEETEEATEEVTKEKAMVDP
jgi:hypothetical protein